MTQSSEDSAQLPSNDEDSVLSAIASLSLENTAQPRESLSRENAAQPRENTSTPRGPCLNPPRIYISTRPGDEQDYPNCCRCHQLSFEKYLQSITAGQSTSTSTVVIRAYDAYTQLLSSTGGFRLPVDSGSPPILVQPSRGFGNFHLPNSDHNQAGNSALFSQPALDLSSISTMSVNTALPEYTPLSLPAPPYISVNQDLTSTIGTAFVAAAATPGPAVTTLADAQRVPVTIIDPASPVPAPVVATAAAAPIASGSTCRTHRHIPAHSRWYVVTRGTRPGIHRGWHIASPLVIGIRSSSYVGFDTKEEATQVWLEALDAGVVTEL